MYARALVLAAVLVTAAAALAQASDFVTTVVDPYLRIQTALAADRLDGVNAEATAIATASRQLGSDGSRIKSAAAELQGARSIDTARTAFGKLSDAIIAYAEARKAELGPGTKKAYCPMEKQQWLQKGPTIANPYAGKKMLRCGEFKS